MLKNKLYQYGDDSGRIPAHIHFGKEVFDAMVKNKHITALINADTGDQISYEEVAQMTADVALSLTRIGVRKGEVVCICSEKIFEYLPTIIGIMCAGATFSPTDPTYGSFPLLHRLKIVRPRVMFCSRNAYKTHKAVFEEVGSIEHYILYGDEEEPGTLLFKDFLTETCKLEDFEPVPVNGWEDVAFIVYSSGTTGLPKGVPVTHLAYCLNAQNIVPDDYTGIGIYSSREFYYTYGLMYALACLRVAATIVYNTSGGEKAMLEAVEKYKLKILQLAPMIITELIKSAILDDYDLSSVEYVISSSTYIREEAVNDIKRRIPSLKSVLQLYGMSEGGSICNELLCTKGSKPGSSGVPGYGFIIKVVDLETRKPLGPNQRGEICIKGPSLMKAYLNNVSPECKDEDGFLKSGDVGYYDEDGYFFVVNRIKELIKYNDISIPPAEFEALLLQHPSVREVGVVGKPHHKHGELPVAFVVLQPGCKASEDELVQHVDSRVTFRMRLAGGVRFIDRLPRGAGDKLDRRDLVQRLIDEDKPDGNMDKPNGTVLNGVRDRM
ncbi:luciferin 4-monooxygenase [Helicoverpa armigera]|uniref:luciferin 4-monooxygenase n=1 Tax=Helicoverpa armigera TaxID=29058 RepID=UPI00308310F3